jgi:hypothetical protein
LKAIKRTNKREKLGQLTSFCPKFLKDDLIWFSVENICDVYLKHYPIRMGIQNGLDIMDHNFITFSNCHSNLIWWQWEAKPSQKPSWNYKHKTLLISC